MKKKLLIFAHRGEARAFLNHFAPKALPFLEGLYSSIDHFFLITGEGPWKAGPKLALVLGKYKDEISELVNLGIAGALRPDVEVGEIYPIRSVFLEQNGDMQFASHQLQEDGIDLITCHTRVLKSELADHLDSFAPLVDRELWALAQAASLSGLPLQAKKLISDKVGDSEICQRVKENSEEMSDRLLSDYLSQQQSNPSTQAQVSWEGFYFTTSLKNQRDKLLQGLIIKFDDLDSALAQLNIEGLRSTDELPKKRASLLVERMKDLLNPVQKEVKDSLEELSIGIQKTGAQIKFPKDFERAQFHLSAHIEKAEDIVSLIKALEDFNYTKLVNLIEGKDLNV